MQKSPIVITLTAIPPRFQNLGRKFRAIEKQTLKPDHVELNIPEFYRRFPGEVPSLPPLPKWVSVKRCQIDYGPATKVLPTVERWRNTVADLLVCDDDRIPDRHWIERLAAARQIRPNDIITERGWNINERFGIERAALAMPRACLAPKHGRTPAYLLKRLMSLTLAHPNRKLFSSPGFVDVFEGFLGVLIPSTAIPQAAFTIPDVIWTLDDVWLSGIAHAYGTGIWVHDTPRPVFSDGYFDKISSLRDFAEAGYDRERADLLAVEYLRTNHQAWQ